MICISNYLCRTVILWFTKTNNTFIIFISALIDLSEPSTDEKKQIDIYAIGFEEMVDLDAKNIVNAR